MHVWQSMHRGEGSHDDERHGPPLMGGDGSHGPGVLVSTEQPHREENVDGETVTLQLQHPSSNDDNPILCSVVCNRRAIRASSSLISNLLDNMDRDDEVLPPFSTEHIANELTLRRVVEFVTELEPALAKDCLSESLLLESEETAVCFLFDTFCRAPKPKDICESVQNFFRRVVDEDGHRGGVLNLLLAAHYLCCNNLKNACIRFLAMAIGAWAESGAKTALFGEDSEHRFGTAGDPLLHVGAPILCELAACVAVTPTKLRQAYNNFSAALVVAVAQCDRFWDFDQRFAFYKEANLADPTCPICVVLEARLQHAAHERIDLLPKALEPTVDKRWSVLVDGVVEQSIRDNELWTNGPPSWVQSINLTNPNCLVTKLMARRAKLNSSAPVYLPPVADQIAGECARKYFRFATRHAHCVVLEPTNPSLIKTLLQETTSLNELHLWRTSASSWERLIPSTFQSLLNVLLLQSMIIDRPDSHILGVLPATLKCLWLRNLYSCGDSYYWPTELIQMLQEQPHLTQLEHFIVDNDQQCEDFLFDRDVVNVLISSWKFRLENQKLRVWLTFTHTLHQFPYNTVQEAQQNGIELCHISVEGPHKCVGRRLPSCLEEGEKGSNIRSWPQVDLPPLTVFR